MTTKESWVKVEEIAAHLGVSKDTIYRWIDERDLPAHKVGRLYRFKVSEIDSWVTKSATSDDSLEDESQNNPIED